MGKKLAVVVTGATGQQGGPLALHRSPVRLLPVPLDVIRQRMGEDGAKMYEWFDRVGYTVDRAALRREFPDVAFRDFESWARAEDWNARLQSA